MLAKELLTAYATEHDISPDAVAQLRYGIAAFARHLGRAATAKDFAPASVNAWLAAEVQRVSKRTARNYRASVLTLWRYAFDDGLTEQPPLRVRKIAAPLPPVEAYEPAEIEALLAACDKLPIKWRFLMRAYILVAWQTVFRVGDLLLLRWGDCDTKHHAVTIVQHKTGIAITRPIDADALAAIELAGGDKRKLVFGHALTRRTVWKIFRRVRQEAGIARGCPKWLRRSSATAIMRAHGEEAGSRALGHRTPGLARKHYFAAKHVLAEQLRAPRLRKKRNKTA